MHIVDEQIDSRPIAIIIECTPVRTMFRYDVCLLFQHIYKII